MKSVLKWAYADSLQYIGFMIVLGLFIAFLMTFIVYPIQTIATVVIGFIGYLLFTLANEWK